MNLSKNDTKEINYVDRRISFTKAKSPRLIFPKRVSSFIQPQTRLHAPYCSLLSLQIHCSPLGRLLTIMSKKTFLTGSQVCTRQHWGCLPILCLTLSTGFPLLFMKSPKLMFLRRYHSLGCA